MRSQNLSLMSFAMAAVCVGLVLALVFNARIQEMSGAEAVYEYLRKNESDSFSEVQMKKVSAAVNWSHEKYSDIENDERLLLWYSVGLVAIAFYFLRMGFYFGGKGPNKAPEPTPGAVTPRATEGASK